MRNLFTALLLMFAINSLQAAHYEVQMVNRNALGAMSYEPSYLHIQPGDTVKFIRTAPGHNAAAIVSMWPADAKQYRGNINEEIEMTFDKAGIYGIECTPHMAMGMVMVIQVGKKDLPAIQAPKSLPSRAKQRIQTIKTHYSQQ